MSNPNSFPWTEEQDDYLRAHYATTRNAELAEDVGCHVKALGRRLKKLGLTGGKSGEVWKGCAERLNKFNATKRKRRTPEEQRAANAAARRRKYRVEKGLAPDAPLNRSGNTNWTVEQENFVRANWHRMTTGEIGEKLGRSARSVDSKGRRMGLPEKGRPVSSGSSAPSRSRKMHPLPTAPIEPSLAQLAAARAAMKKKPGPMARGWRVRSSWR